MFNSETLEVAIGMAFLFLCVSLICTAVKEWFEGIVKWRAMDLERGLRTLLADVDGTLTAELLRHPLLYSLFPGDYDPTQLRRSWFAPGKGSLHMRLSHRRNLPSYIPAAQFATALLDCVARGPMPAPVADGSVAAAAPLPVEMPDPGPITVEALRANTLNLASPYLRRALLAALDHSEGDLARARLNLEAWFNGTMDRASGWYKRRTQAVLFVFGFCAAAALNLDAFYVMQRLITDKTFREVVVKEASNAGALVAASSAPDTAASGAQNLRMANAKQALDEVGMPIGWLQRTPPVAASSPAGVAPATAWALPLPRQLCRSAEACPRSQWLGEDWLPVLAGWLATAFAVMLGAPFWFDVLNRLMVIRSTVKPHEKSPEESSQDRQQPTPEPAEPKAAA